MDFDWTVMGILAFIVYVLFILFVRIFAIIVVSMYIASYCRLQGLVWWSMVIVLYVLLNGVIGVLSKYGGYSK